MQFSVSFDTANSPSLGSLTASEKQAVLDVMNAAATIWSHYLTLANITISINIIVNDSLFSGNVLAVGGPDVYGATGATYNGKTVYASDADIKLNTGTDINGSAPDIDIGLTTNSIRNLLTFKTDDFATVTANRYDALSVFLHEIGHGLGIVDASQDPSFPGVGIYDTFVQNGYFTGANAEAAAGAPSGVPLEPGSLSHIKESSAYGGDLMSTAINAGTNVHVSAIDLGILQDIGVPVRTATSGDDMLYALAGVDLHLGAGNDTGYATAGGSTIYGEDGNDTLYGDKGADTLYGGNNDDTLTGGAGNDTLDGGAGTDTAVYSGLASNYQVTRLTPTSYRVTDLRSGSPDGTDTLSDIERLQWGDGSFTSIGPVNIVDNDELTYTGAGVIYDNISGTGHVSLKGAGALHILMGNLNQTGGTALYEGALIVGDNGGGSPTGSIAGDIVLGINTPNVSLAFNRSNDYTYSGNISGQGEVDQDGPATLTLSGTNTYAGKTYILKGVLAIYGDANLGTGPVGIGFGTLRFLASTNSALAYQLTQGAFDTNGFNVTLSGILSTANGVDTTGGYGGFTKLGAGTLILAGNNTYSGPTVISSGTLQVGNLGTTGSLGSAAVTDNANLTFNRSDNIIVANVISGTGSLTQSGSGNLILTGNNTYSGGTTISAGVLMIGTGGISGSVLGDIVDNSELTLWGGTVSGNVSGTGHVSFRGAYSHNIITGNYTQTGGTTIFEGAVVVGPAISGGGTTGFIAGDIVVGVSTFNSGIVFNHSDNITVSGNISGQGYVKQNGTGSLLLTGNNTYTGGTTIAQGQLSLLSASAIGAGDIQMYGFFTSILYLGASMSLAQNIQLQSGVIYTETNTNVTLSGAISTLQGYQNGGGGFGKGGAGTLTLSGNNTYVGPTVVNTGSLLVDGSTASSTFTAEAGTILGGTGTVGSTYIKAGSKLAGGDAPGGIGTLHVNGDLTFQGGTLSEDISSSAADEIIVSGNANISGALTENFAGSGYAPHTYTILHSTGTLSGTFSSIATTGLPAGMYAQVTYDAHNVYLTTRAIPNISIGDASVTEGGVLHFGVTMDTAAAQNVTLAYDTYFGTASMADNDYVGGQGTLTIQAGQTTGTINVQTVQDSKVEPDETMSVHLESTSFGIITQAIGNGTIVNDDVAPGIPNISIGDASVTEGGVLHFAVTLDKPATQNITLGYDTYFGTASMADNDYLGGAGTLTIQAGQTTGTINVQTVQDSKVEPDETMSVHLQSTSFGSITQAVGTGTIVNDDVAPIIPNISIGDASVTEGGVLHFAVTLDRAAAQNITLGYDTYFGTASMADNDYLGGAGTLTIQAGQTTGTINVQTVQDSKVEPDETMSVHLQSTSFGSITQAVGTGTIVNDDVAPIIPNISIGDASVTEGGVLHFVVTLDRATTQNVTLGYDTYFGTASMADNDYLGGAGTLTIQAGQTTGTINIQTVQDSKVEPDETMSVHLESTSFGTITQSVGNGTIVNDDVAPGVPNISVSDASVTEGGVLHFIVTLDKPATQNVTLGYDTYFGTASMADNDYVGGQGTLTIQAGQTTGIINIQTVQDSKIEPDETMSVHLESTSFGTITQAVGTGTIVNDDGISQLAADIAKAVGEISAQVQSGSNFSSDLGASDFYLDEKALVASIAADIAVLHGSENNYTIGDGFIETIGSTSDASSALVQTLDPDVGPAETWSLDQQVDLNGGSNQNIAAGTPIATFVNGEYPGADQHAGFFLGYGSEGGNAGFFMLDQYANQPTLSPSSQCAEVRFCALSSPIALQYFTIHA